MHHTHIRTYTYNRRTHRHMSIHISYIIHHTYIYILILYQCNRYIHITHITSLIYVYTHTPTHTHIRLYTCIHTSIQYTHIYTHIHTSHIPPMHTWYIHTLISYSIPIQIVAYQIVHPCICTCLYSSYSIYHYLICTYTIIYQLTHYTHI